MKTLVHNDLWRSLLLLAIASLIAGGLTAFRPLPRGYTPPGKAPQAIPAIIPVAEAQLQVPFPISAPKYIPGGGTLLGVRVTHVVDISPTPKPNIKRIRRLNEQSKKFQHRFRGFGLLVGRPNGDYDVRAIAGSPAAKAGISTQSTMRLMAVNGRSIHQIGDAQVGRTPRGMVPSSVIDALHQPREITVRLMDTMGRTSTVTIRHKGDYIYPDAAFFMPEHLPPVIHSRQAALLLNVRGKSLALIESRPERGETVFPTVGGVGTRPLIQRGDTLYLSGPDYAPSVGWSHSGKLFWLFNYQLAINKQEALRLVSSVQQQPNYAASGPPLTSR